MFLQARVLRSLEKHRFSMFSHLEMWLGSACMCTHGRWIRVSRSF